MKYSTKLAIQAVVHIFLIVLGIFVVILSLAVGFPWVKGISGIFPQAGALTLVVAGMGAGAVLIGKGLFFILDVLD